MTNWIYYRSIATIKMVVVNLPAPALTARFPSVSMTSHGAGSAG